ncbi:TPA: hypothetical protein QHR34_004075 [Raoultella ornithinolytica]|nr:hypothetical protein [Raoultella ornithinolytica]HDT1249904.1 hypothetical protein [Raoultella ornithinolytica]
MTKRISNKLTLKEAQDKLMKVLKSKGHCTKPDMSTYTAYNNPIRMYCTSCGLDKTIKYNNAIDRGCICICARNSIKAEKKRIKDLSKIKVVKPLHDRWIENDYINRVQDVCPNLIPLPQTFTNRAVPMRMYCTLCNTIVDKRVGDALRGNNCGNCFGVGFRKDREATLYVLKLMYEDVHIGYKFGITNKTAAARCKAINKHSELQCRVIYSYTSDGERIFNLEKELKSTIPRNYINKSLMDDGSTETFSPQYINDVIQFIFKIV